MAIISMYQSKDVRQTFVLLQIIFDHGEENDPDRQTPVLFTQRYQ